MSDLISKKDALAVINAHRCDTANIELNILNLPTVEAVPVVHGEWILEEKAGVDYWCCSHCHKIRSEYYAKPKDNFCPECGADMRKKV